MIPFIDLKAQYRILEHSIRQRIENVLDHGQFILGPEVTEIEEKLARFSGAQHCVCCASGTDALLMALMLQNIGPGDAVITSPFTFVATAEVISLLGATPVFIDIDPATFNMDPEKLETAILAIQSKKAPPCPLAENASGLTVKAIITVDLFGLPCDYDIINRIAARHGITVIEDAAQSFGGEYKGRKTCSLSDIGCTSFFPAKPLGCYGDGGAVFTDSEEKYRELLSIRVHGQGKNKYENVRIGINGRLDTLQAAILLPKLEIFPRELEMRNRAAILYNRLFSPFTDIITTPSVPPQYLSAWAQYSIMFKEKKMRAQIQGDLSKEGIPSAIYYPVPLHLQPAFSNLGYKKGDFPVSEYCADRILSLPMHPYLTEETQKMIVDKISRLTS